MKIMVTLLLLLRAATYAGDEPEATTTATPTAEESVTATPTVAPDSVALSPAQEQSGESSPSSADQAGSMDTSRSVAPPTQPQSTPAVSEEETSRPEAEQNDLAQFDLSNVLGISLALQKDGSIIIADVKAGSVATRMGLHAGDRVVAVNDKPLPVRETEPRPITQEGLAQLAGLPQDTGLLVTLEHASGGSKINIQLLPRPKLSPQ